jgi:hypothetical protein
MTDCTGTWGAGRSLADDTVDVSVCDGCGEMLAIYRSLGYHFPPHSSERTILTTIWTAVGRSVA